MHLPTVFNLIWSVIFCSCITLILCFIKWKFDRRKFNKLSDKIPPLEGLKSFPVLGHSVNFLGDTEQFFKVARHATAKCDRPRKIWIFHKLFVAINRPEDMEAIFNSPKCLSKHELYEMTTFVVGRGLFTLPVPEWKRHRRTIMPTFNQRILDKFVEVFSDQAEVCVQQLKGKTGQIIDFFTYATKYGLDIVCETAMGISVNAQTTDTELEHTIHRLMEIAMTRVCNVPYHSNWIFNLTRLSKEGQQLADKFHGFIREVVENKLEAYRRERSDLSNSADEKKSVAFLELLIELSENGDKWTIDELKSEVSTFLIGGSDTGATVNSFTLLLLAMHPDIQEKCYEEVMEVLGPDRQLEFTDLPKLTYLEKVIKESMRLFPAGPMLLRKVDDDVEVGGYVIPKGAGIWLAIFSMHNSELYYKDPSKFDPERFSPEETAKRHKYAYLPFSGGPRNCIGLKFGMMSMKTLLAVLIRRYRVETVYGDISEIRLRQSILLNAVDGFPIRFISRKPTK